MKKLLLIVLAIGISFATVAQQNFGKKVSTERPTQHLTAEAPASNLEVVPDPEGLPNFETTINGRAVEFVQIGITGNAYGFYGNPRTYVWADPMINSVVLTHRMTGGTEIDGNSRVSYDVSTDGGSTWINNVHVYSPLGEGDTYPYAAGRYTQGLIINPDGNTNPDDAFYSYFVATIIDENGIWGGYAYGNNVLTQTDPPMPTQTNLTSGDGYWRLIPDAYHVTPQAVAWVADGSFKDDGSGTFNYTGEYIINRGEIDDNDSLVFEEELYAVLDENDGINDTKIAFADDGQTGYICIMSDSPGSAPEYTNYHPILLKTTDGGESWEDPVHIQLGGDDGLENLKNYFTDEAILGAGYPEGFDRDEVYYNMGYSVDMVIDQDGNPYLTGIIAIGDADGWYPNETQMATWNVFSEDGGATWNCDALYDNIWLQGDIGAIAQYNRPYASRSLDGHYLFFSWLDSDIDVATQNDRPNIYVVGYDVEDNVYSDVFNVTYFTQAWNMAFFGSQSYYVFDVAEARDDEMVTFEIPFVYEEFTVPGDDTQQCNFWYINGYTLDMPVNVPELDDDAVSFSVQQNFPNPAATQTSVLVNAQTDLPIQFTLSNLLGQTIYTDMVDSRAMAHTFKVDVRDFNPGIYFYTVQIGNNTITKKMLVE